MKMKSSGSLWIIAFFVTVATAYFQRITGPTYPVTGSIHFKDAEVKFNLPRSHDTGTYASFHVTTSDTVVQGLVEWKMYKSSGNWNRVAMVRDSIGLKAGLPDQPPAGKLEYRVILTRADEAAVIPAEDTVVIRFKGSVPIAILIVHIVAMFAAMLFAARAGLEFFGDGSRLRSLIYSTMTLTVIGGFVLGPVVQHYAFEAWWTGWPWGTDLTDNKTAIMLTAWIVALVALRKAKRPRAWALAAAIVTFIVFLIPHSLFGSELRQSPTEQLRSKIDTAMTR